MTKAPAMSEREKQQVETIRCMSNVFDDIATMLNLPKNKYGNPDALMGAIEALQETVEPVPRIELLVMLRRVWGCGETVACRIIDCLEDNGVEVLRKSARLSAIKPQSVPTAIDMIKALRDELQRGVNYARLGFPTLTVMPPIDTRARFIANGTAAIAQADAFLRDVK